MGEQLKVVGEHFERIDAREKVTGEARFAIDLAWPDVLHGAIVRSDRAHALLLGVEREVALARPGVVAVIAADDLEGIFGRFGHHIPDHPILAQDRVRFYGEPVAVVVADSPDHAQDALEDVRVRYEDLEPLMDVAAAMRDGAALIHPEKPPTGTPIGPSLAGRQDTNEAYTAGLEWGDVDAALADAEATVVTTRAQYPRLYAYAMETYNSQARFVGGTLEVVSTAQHPFQVQRDLARVFAMDLSRVQVSVPYIGGGYGSKSYSKLEPLAAACSWALNGRGVRIAVDVEGAMYTTRADGADVTVTSAFDAQGRLLARDIDITLDTGAYADNSPQVLRRCVTRSIGPYRIPSLRVRARAVHTTTVPASSYRGFGGFHTSVASEGNIDEAADQLGIDPVELRLLNVVERGEAHVRGLRPMDADLASNLRLVAERLSIEPREGVLQGKGTALVVSDAGARPTSTAIVRLIGDGSAVLQCGSAEMGQGSRTVLAAIVAEELGLPLERVRVISSDTATTPFQWTTGASRTTTIVGLSVQRACQDVVRQLVELAAADAGQATDAWRFENGRVVHPDGSASEPRAVISAWYGDGWGEIVGVGRTQQRGDLEQLPVFWEIGLVGVAVDIDPLSGKVRIDQLVTLGDVGRVILPAGVEGQDLGAAMQGIGGALFEEIVYDGPQIVNANIVEYRVPRITDLARRIDSIVVERGDGPGPYGAKGLGEGAMTAVGSAIVSAVAQAIGVRPEVLPLTPMRICELLDLAEERPGRDSFVGRASS